MNNFVKEKKDLIAEQYRAIELAKDSIRKQIEEELGVDKIRDIQPQNITSQVIVIIFAKKRVI